MSDPALEVQAAMVARLKATNVLPSVVAGRVYDAAPPEAAFPYVTIGPCQVLPDKANCIDGAEIFPQVDVWSRAVGYPETKQITKAVVAALDDKPLDVEDFNVVIFEVQSIQYLRDPDGLTSHAAITFHGVLTPA